MTLKGLKKIIAIKASMNKGLSKELKVAFPDIVPVKRPSVKNQKIMDPNWLAGFTNGEGCFMINITPSSRNLLGFQVWLRFSLGQHSRDEKLLNDLIKFFGPLPLPCKGKGRG